MAKAVIRFGKAGRSVAIGRDERRRDRRPQVESHFSDEEVERALDLFEIVELAWHDIYGEVTPPDRVVDEMLTFSRGDLKRLLSGALLGLRDPRDLHMSVNTDPAN